MTYEDDVTLETLVHDLIAPCDTDCPIDRHLHEDLRQIAWEVYRDAAREKFSGKKADSNWLNQFVNRHSPSAKDPRAPSSSVPLLIGLLDDAPHVADQGVIDTQSGRTDRIASGYMDIPDIGMKLTLKYNGVGITLTQSEAHIFVGLLGDVLVHARHFFVGELSKRLELPLMLTLAKLYSVPKSHYSAKGLTGQSREVDFHFVDRTGIAHYCEVKLMGKGNPESADSAIARDSNIFIAHTLSAANKEQLTRRNTQWVELRQRDGYQKLFRILQLLDIPCAPFTGDLDAALDDIIPQVFAEIA